MQVAQLPDLLSPPMVGGFLPRELIGQYLRKKWPIQGGRSKRQNGIVLGL